MSDRDVLTVRPKVAELVFQLYGRSLHPELFEVHESRTITRSQYTAKIEITTAGHLVTWQHQGMTLTEVCTSAHHPLPQRRRLMTYKLNGKRKDGIDCRGGVSYHVDFALEKIDPELFWTFQQEMSHEHEHEGMLHHFGSSGRMKLGGMSYINVESRSRNLLIQAFHTFPDDGAIVKIQSQFVCPQG
jgi:hypothetical protein